jgi:3-(3-hydroxy-phenyl)propionate hydroxylase
MSNASLLQKNFSVLIAGGGPVGLTLAALLAKQGIKALVIEADTSYCTGSRAICVSRRSQEILGWAGAGKALAAKGLPWVGGRSYFRDQEVLHFTMPSEPTERFAPMVNIQQFYIEEFAHKAGGFDVAWGCKIVKVSSFIDHSEVDVESSDGQIHHLTTDWLVACDGGKSTVREQLGLSLEGVQYEGRYVIIDIKQKTQRPVERLAWFDPPSNPGSTLLMHRQPDDVWRIDYQIADDEDPFEAVKPENVLPRVQSHLAMIGENEPWEAMWISIYNAKCLTLPDYQHNRIFFAGDAAHLVPIFGVRGLNSGLDDAGNLAWKLAAVLHGKADEKFLRTYTEERLHATHENIYFGAKSTEFMAPPHAGFKLMREAALRLSLENDSVRSLINPRQSTPIEYPDSKPAPESVFVRSIANDKASETHLSQYFGKGFITLFFTNNPAAYPPIKTELSQVIVVNSSHAQAWQRYEGHEGMIVLIRPDGYIAHTWTVQSTLPAAPPAIDSFIHEAMHP